MPSSSLIRSLSPLKEEVLRIVVSESEARLLAQLQVASSADQRSLALAGFTIAATSASITAFVYLLESESQRAGLFIGTLLMTFGLLVATSLALASAWSRQYTLPGSRPALWIPKDWANGPVGGRTVKHALLEQAHCLEIAITDNKAVSRTVGRLFNLAMVVALVTVLASAIVVVSIPN